MEENELRPRIAYRTIHGSRAYGTNIEGSDVDEKGFAILTDPKYYLGFSRFDQKDSGWSDGFDRSIYDIRKFFKLASACNPNIIEVLFVEDEDILEITPIGRRVRDMRYEFLSKKAAKTFGGYAINQIRLLRNNNEAFERHNVGTTAKGSKKLYKNAMHLVRILRMGIELLRDGEVNVRRKDAAELLSIRNGDVPIQSILAWADDAKIRLNNALHASSLPDKADVNKLEGVMIELIKEELLWK